MRACCFKDCQKPPARAVCAIPTCDAHRPDVTLDYLLTDEGWAQIQAMFRRVGRVCPNRADTQLEFIELHSAEAISFFRARES